MSVTREKPTRLWGHTRQKMTPVERHHGAIVVWIKCGELVDLIDGRRDRRGQDEPRNSFVAWRSGQRSLVFNELLCPVEEGTQDRWIRLSLGGRAAFDRKAGARQDAQPPSVMKTAITCLNPEELR